MTISSSAFSDNTNIMNGVM